MTGWELKIVGELGMTGFELKTELFTGFGVDLELADGALNTIRIVRGL